MNRKLLFQSQIHAESERNIKSWKERTQNNVNKMPGDHVRLV